MRLADAFAGERIGAAGGFAGDQQARRVNSARLRASSAAARPSAHRAACRRPSTRAPAHTGRRRRRRSGAGSGPACAACRCRAMPKAVGQADADVEHAVAAREDPAVAWRQARVPDDFQRADAPDHRRVLHITAQRDAAGRAPFAHPGGDEACGTAPVASTSQGARISCKSRRPSGARPPPAAQRGLSGIGRSPSSSGASKRAGGSSVAPARCAARHRMSSSTLRGSTATDPGTSTRPPRGPTQPTCVAGCACAITSS